MLTAANSSGLISTSAPTISTSVESDIFCASPFAPSPNASAPTFMDAAFVTVPEPPSIPSSTSAPSKSTAAPGSTAKSCPCAGTRRRLSSPRLARRAPSSKRHRTHTARDTLGAAKQSRPLLFEHVGFNRRASGPISRVLSKDGHLSRTTVTCRL